jgi:hypothetical protein
MKKSHYLSLISLLLVSNSVFAIPASVPEPETYLLLGAGAAVAALMKWKSSKRK